MVRIKICGITNFEDADRAVTAGADALGFVFFSGSPRNIHPAQATEIIRRLPPFIQTVGLFVDEDQATVNSIADNCGLDLIQLHGAESPEYCEAIRRRVIKAFRVRDDSVLSQLGRYDVSGHLLDAWSPSAHGGTGRTFNWDIAAAAVQLCHRIILAGGLSPVNVAEGIRQVRPYGVDVSSGVEETPGRKDAAGLVSFIEHARSAAHSIDL